MATQTPHDVIHNLFRRRKQNKLVKEQCFHPVFIYQHYQQMSSIKISSPLELTDG